MQVYLMQHLWSILGKLLQFLNFYIKECEHLYFIGILVQYFSLVVSPISTICVRIIYDLLIKLMYVHVWVKLCLLAPHCNLVCQSLWCRKFKKQKHVYMQDNVKGHQSSTLYLPRQALCLLDPHCNLVYQFLWCREFKNKTLQHFKCIDVLLFRPC